MVTPPAFPSRRTTEVAASTVRVSLAPSVPENEYLPSVRARTQTGSAAVTSTLTGPPVPAASITAVLTGAAGAAAGCSAGGMTVSAGGVETAGGGAGAVFATAGADDGDTEA